MVLIQHCETDIPVVTMSMKLKKKVGFASDVKSGEGKDRESRSRSRSRFHDRRSKSHDVSSGEKRETVPIKRDRSLIALVRTGSRNSVRSLVKLFENVAHMNEGRKSQIILPDERRLDLLIQPKLGTRDLLDLVASHFKLKEKEYFGLCFQDDSGHYNWLNLDKRVLDHDFQRRVGLLVLLFSVRYYVESIATLKDVATVELFYLNAKQAVFRSQIECDSDTVFELAGYVLQATHGDYIDDDTTKAALKKLPVIPTSTLREHPSISFCEERIIEHYKKVAGSTKGLAIVNYLSVVESLPTYGIHYYEVKDKKDHPWLLGLSHKGIAVYDKTDKTTPRKIFTWKQLENLYYRDKKFSVEVHDTKRVVHTLSSFNLYEDALRETPDELDDLSDAISDPTTQVSVSRRTFGPGNVIVHAWFCSTPQLTKCIWSMAVSQHQFYLDRKHSKSNLPQARSLSEIAEDLSRSSSSLRSIGTDSFGRSGSSVSLPSLTASQFDINFDPSDAIKEQRVMYSALKARKEALEETLKAKTEELKKLCIKEGELTGILPLDYPSLPGESLPTIRKRVGTAFSLQSKVDDDTDAASKIELEYELQKQITSAALRLSQDKSVSKYVRKQRKQSYQKAHAKLKEMEKKLAETKGPAMNKPKPGFLSPAVPSYDGLRVVSPLQSPELPPRSPRTRKLDLKPHDRSPHLQRSATARDLSPTSPSPPVLSPTLSSPQLNALGYSNKSGNYRGTAFQPPLTNRSASSGSNMSNQSEYENVRQYKGFETGSQDSGFSSNNNMYNLMTQRKSHYESTDELKTPTHGCNDSVFSDRQYSRHGSLDGSFRKQSSSQQNYGSLERNSRRRDHWSQRDRQLSDSEASVHLSELEPSRFGSKRNSQSEYDLTSPRNNVVEVPVHHEQTRGNHRRYKSTPWEDSAIMEQSPIIQSPDKDFEKQCYSPRLHEGNFFSNKGQIPYSTDQNSAKSTESPRYSRQSNALVTVTKIQPHRNVEVVSKPFEMSDFYKYSEKIRRQRMIDQYQQQLMGGSRCSSPSQHSTDSGDNSSLHSGSNSSYHHHHSVIHSPTQPSPAHSTVSINSPYKSGQTYVSNSRQNSPFRDHEQQYKSPPSHRSAKFQAVKEQSTHVQYTMQTPSGARVYKSVQTRHTHYQPLTPQKCDPIRNQVGTPVKSHNSNASGSTPKTMERSSRLKTTVPQPCMSPGLMDVSLGTIVGENFSEEVMEWIDQKNPSYV